MGTTKSDIERWFSSGREHKADYMIVVCDTYDWEDYPVYCTEENYFEKYASVDNKKMQKIMEVYNLNMDFSEQCKHYRANFGPKK